MLKIIFLTESSARNLTGGRGIFRKSGNVQKEYYGEEIYITWEKKLSHHLREFFLEGEPNLPVLFEKQLEFNKKEVFSAESKEKY